MGGVVGTILDPAGIFRQHGGYASPQPENAGEHIGEPAPAPAVPDYAAQMAPLLQAAPGSEMGRRLTQGWTAGPQAPPPPAHWSFSPGQGTSWATPDKRLTADNQYSWNNTAPGAAPGNRI